MKLYLRLRAQTLRGFFDRLKCPEGSSSGHLVYIIMLQPLSPPACNPETKYFWQRMNTMSTGTRLATDMANT